MLVSAAEIKVHDYIIKHRAVVASISESPEGMMVLFEGERLPMCFPFEMEVEVNESVEDEIAQAQAECDAENAWLRHAENQGMDHQEELRQEGLA